jgi:hypothetical protein
MSGGQKSIASFFGGGAAKANAPAAKRVADDAAKGTRATPRVPDLAALFLQSRASQLSTSGFEARPSSSPSPVPDRFPPSSPRA